MCSESAAGSHSQRRSRCNPPALLRLKNQCFSFSLFFFWSPHIWGLLILLQRSDVGWGVESGWRRATERLPLDPPHPLIQHRRARSACNPALTLAGQRSRSPATATPAPPAPTPSHPRRWGEPTLHANSPSWEKHQGLLLSSI